MIFLFATLSFLPFQDPLFIERPGEVEFSGRLIARPIERNDNELSEFLQSQTVKYFPATDEYILDIPEGMDENSYAQTLFAMETFEYVRPDWTCYPLRDPNDPQFPNQWQGRLFHHSHK